MRALALILPAVLVACIPTATIRPSASPSPVSATVVPTASASPSPARPSPTAATREYGLIVGSRGFASFVRSETSDAKLADIQGVDFLGAVSPDGRSVAYWEAQPTVGARVLRTFEGASAAQPRVLLTLPETELATGEIAWSNDGRGVLIGVVSRERLQGVEAPPAYAALRQVDVATGGTREIARNERTFVFAPVAWDRARGVSAAVETGAGGFVVSYVVVRDGSAPLRTQMGVELSAQSVVAAPDASGVAGISPREGAAVHVWPLAEPRQRAALTPAQGERVATVLWRNARELIVSVTSQAPTAPPDRLEVWPIDQGPRRVVLRAEHRLDAVRPDGTAAIAEHRLVDLTTGATGTIAGIGSTRQVLASFVLR